MLIIDKNSLYEEYVLNGKTDKKIASELKVDRTYISKLRKEYGIVTRESTGLLGENKVKEKLDFLGIGYEDMNLISKLYDYDLNCNGLKVEIKSARKGKDGFFTFTLSEKSNNGNKNQEKRIILDNRRTKKLFEKTCDVFIFVCFSEQGENSFYLMESQDLEETRQTLSLNPNSTKSKYNKFKDNWSLLIKNCYKGGEDN